MRFRKPRPRKFLLYSKPARVRKISPVCQKVVHLLDADCLAKLTDLLAAGPVRKRDVLNGRSARFRQTYREALLREVIQESGCSGHDDPVMVGLSGCTFIKKVRWTRADLKLLIRAGCSPVQARQLLDAACDNQPDERKLLALVQGARWKAEKRENNQN